MIPIDILNYRIVRHLGTGGMGSVFLAVNTSIDQQVAIKMLKPEYAGNAMLRARFKQEAQMLCSLDHPGIVKFLNYVESPEGVFLIMEYVKGITLENFIKNKNGLIVEKRAYPMLCEILDAFEYAHSMGIVHRDIKPSNIIIQDDGHVKVMDFGIAQIISETENQQGRIRMGTPSFMSPEQICSSNVDQRSDIYSLGVLIHNMLTGRAPYDSTMLTDMEIMRMVVNNELPRMKDIYPYISDGMQCVVDKATLKQPQMRYSSCREMKTAVKKYLAPDPIPRHLLYGGIGLAAILVLSAFFTWDYFRTKTEYYKDYVEIYGVPKGIGSLSSREMSHREASYRFEYSRYKLRRVSYVNSYGNLIDHHDSEDKDRIVDMTINYSEGSENIDVAKYYNRSGKVLYVKDYDSKFRTCTFKLDDELGTEMTLNAQVSLFQSAFDSSLDGKSRISKYILQHDDDGYLTKLEYAGFGNVRVSNGQGIFGSSYVRDEKGRVIEEHYLGKDGKPKATQFGLGVKRFTYDDDDNLVKIEYQTVDGKPSSDGNNCPVVLLEYDKWGNRIAEKYTSVDGKPMIRKDIGVHGIIYQYDSDGLRVKHSYLSLDGSPAYVNGVNGCVYEYDDNGYVQAQLCVDASGNSAFFNDTEKNFSYSKIKISNDEHGNPLDLQFLTANNEYVDAAIETHIVRTYDTIGNMITEYYLNEKGEIFEPANTGYAGVEIAYNQQGRIYSVTYMGADKKKMLTNDHYCYSVREYDARGNYTRISYYDKDGNLTNHIDGNAMLCFEYDENGNMISRYYQNADGKLCVTRNSYAKAVFGYDEDGNLTSERYFNAEGKPMLVNGIAGTDYKHDKRGNIVIERPIGLNGQLASNNLETHMVYDNLDNVLEKSYYSVGQKKAIGSDGYHKVCMKYNTNNKIISKKFYNASGNLVNMKGENYASTIAQYDARGNNISLEFYTQTGARGNDHSNVHKYYFQYDIVTGKVSHQLTFGRDGQPIAADGIAPEGRVKYNKRGDRIAIICYDGYGKKQNGLHNWCECRFAYNESGQEVSASYYDINNKPVTDKEKRYHKYTITYNSMRLVESQAYFGENNQPIMLPDGYSICKLKYNNRNQRTDILYFGTNGRPVNNKNGWHREKYSYKLGAQYKCELFDASGCKIGTFLWVNNNWKAASGGSFTRQPQGWKEAWHEIANTCPQKLYDGIELLRVEVGVDAIILNIKFSGLASEDITSEIADKLTELKRMLRRNSKTPSGIEITIVVLDKDNNRVFTI